jgi:hypothetical protein
MKALHIIGNGFDLHHELLTKYENYYSYLGFLYPKEDIAISDIDFSLKYNFEKLLQDNRERDYQKTWADAELVLGECLRSETIRERRGNEIDKLEKIFDESNMRKWILEVNKAIVAKKKSDYFSKLFGEDDLFLCFNYTDTLKTLYGTDDKNICYIHGKASDPASKIYFGHSYDIQMEKNHLKANQVYYGHSHFENTRLDALIEKNHKPIKKIIPAHKSFFESLKEVLHINILGHNIEISIMKEDIISYKDNEKTYCRDTMDNYYYSSIAKHATSLKTVDYYHYPSGGEPLLKDVPYEYKDKFAGSHDKKWMRQEIKFSVKSYPV